MQDPGGPAVMVSHKQNMDFFATASFPSLSLQAQTSITRAEEGHSGARRNESHTVDIGRCGYNGQIEALGDASMFSSAAVSPAHEKRTRKCCNNLENRRDLLPSDAESADVPQMRDSRDLTADMPAAAQQRLHDT
ncbi:hypothetical protein [Rhizobium gallicum]|uniref:hypothetical protein n=1 Tax=Rhizobium gallicum TaxID=56730 RepID=UPI001EF86480|nr:hypothetical protein [Rhizobium gallicum]ULJ72384.1 hypothetical protein L2W42_01220 [Rhizobium gallicum]